MLYRFREVTCKQGFTTGTWYYLYNGLGVGDNMRISSLMASELEFELTSFRVQMKKKWVRNRRKRFYGNMWVNAVGREETWDSLCRMVLSKLLNTCGWIFGACLLLQLKSRSRRGVFGLDIVSKCGIRGGGGLWWREILRGSRRCLPICSKIQAESAVCGAGLCWWTVAIWSWTRMVFL